MQKVLVTGATGSLGEAIVKEFSSQGYFVYIHYNSNKSKAEEILKEIDNNGLSACLAKGLESIQEHLKAQIYLFDGNQTFGVLGISTMVKADRKVPEVSAASILAKVTHDRAIIEAGKKFPLYGFEKHKGYGTKAHIEAIKKHGYCEIHRRSFKVKTLG